LQAFDRGREEKVPVGRSTVRERWGYMNGMRPSIAFASLALVLGLAGCGGSTAGETQSAAIPSSVAESLASQSESISAALGSGDLCGAAQQADDLRHAADDAIASGQIPAAYRDELEAAVTDLQNNVNCDHGDEDHDEEHGKGKAKGHDKDDGVTITTDTIGTTTEEGD
jgi:FlaG/FlaF family flagellin (archaellin)